MDNDAHVSLLCELFASGGKINRRFVRIPPVYGPECALDASQYPHAPLTLFSVLMLRWSCYSQQATTVQRSSVVEKWKFLTCSCIFLSPSPQVLPHRDSVRQLSRSRSRSRSPPRRERERRRSRSRSPPPRDSYRGRSRSRSR